MKIVQFFKNIIDAQKNASECEFYKNDRDKLLYDIEDMKEEHRIKVESLNEEVHTLVTMVTKPEPDHINFKERPKVLLDKHLNRLKDLKKEYRHLNCECIDNEIFTMNNLIHDYNKIKDKDQMGYVYITRNETVMKENIYKVGCTRRINPIDRLIEISKGTGLPGKFELIGFFFSTHCVNTESDIHKSLRDYRLPNSEYFGADLDVIINHINSKSNYPVIFTGDMKKTLR